MDKKTKLISIVAIVIIGFWLMNYSGLFYINQEMSDCLNSNTTCCVDSDNGKDGTSTEIKGYMSYSRVFPSNETYWVMKNSNLYDYCINSNQLNEVYCYYQPGEGDIPSYTYINCPYGCSNGACIPEPITQKPDKKICTDTDGGLNYGAKGLTIISEYISVNGSITNYTKEDTCVDSLNLKEYYCVNSSSYYQTFKCLNGCALGKCIAYVSKNDITIENTTKEIIENLTLGNQFAKIDFKKNVSIGTEPDIEISNSSITVRSSELNVPATLTFYNLTFKNPRVLKDGNNCTTCSIKNYISGTLIVDVINFSTYTIAETTTTSTTTSGTSGGGGSNTNNVISNVTDTVKDIIDEVISPITNQQAKNKNYLIIIVAIVIGIIIYKNRKKFK